MDANYNILQFLLNREDTNQPDHLEAQAAEVGKLIDTTGILPGTAALWNHMACIQT